MYEPVWVGKIEAYAKCKIVKDFWRFQYLGIEYEDLLQESWLVFNFCRKEYQTDTSAHFTSLFKRCLHSKFCALGNFKRLNKERLIGVDDIRVYQHRKGLKIFDDNYIRMLVKQAPEEIKQVISVLLDIPNEVIEMFGIRKGDRITNKILCKLLKKSVNRINFKKMVEDYFTEK